MRHLDKLIVHCSYTKPTMDIGFEEINKWHKANGWKSPSGIHCGYHYIIRRSGKVEMGRPVSEVGAHCRGQNSKSIGVCLVGGMSDDGKPDCNFTLHQYQSLDSIKDIHAGLEVFGHRDFSSKECPCFDADRI